MGDQFDAVAVLNPGVFTGYPLVYGYQNPLFSHQLKHRSQRFTLSLDQLPDGHGSGEIACEIAFSVGCLQLSQ